MCRLSLVTLSLEMALWHQGYRGIAGVDEAGRGALAGPVVAAAVTLAPETELEGIDDSKRLSRKERERLFQRIHQCARGIGVGLIDAGLIDRLNVRQAALQAMRSAIQQLPLMPDYVLIDGLDRVALPLPQQALVRGDQVVASIAAASIIAKVTRDQLMEEYDWQFPSYGFAQHKGYGTAAHLIALSRLGPCAIHRRTFRGVRARERQHG